MHIRRTPKKIHFISTNFRQYPFPNMTERRMTGPEMTFMLQPSTDVKEIKGKLMGFA
jgi:hypothetical protein